MRPEDRFLQSIPVLRSSSTERRNTVSKVEKFKARRSLVSEAQASFGKRLGLDLTGRSVNVAHALIEDAIDVGFHGRMT